MKILNMQTGLIFILLYFSSVLSVGAENNSTAVKADAPTMEAQAIALVDKAVLLIQDQGEAAFKRITAPEGGFFFKDKSLYTFVYDENVVIRAHPYKPTLIGRSYKGKPDVRGNMFRDEIVSKALKNNDGWTEYHYQKPGKSGIHRKKVYGKLVTHDGKKYIVCAGIYID
ncbi:cache domain-containing protein [Candidatus Venteria ishoeyi]|uniref:cache domain-containing protein n=1 Tax=Candidatus Venteria ishoeyi TaxID=1899563 RepID=UPI0025A5BAFF|nr:cache domain-containing protein [Candidatus Venteria ishoeyi]MDM8547281.1 cache domain-containing protein [Candidatus Venteria ishoeyi]